jgi:hypothetical protein
VHVTEGNKGTSAYPSLKVEFESNSEIRSSNLSVDLTWGSERDLYLASVS